MKAMTVVILAGTLALVGCDNNKKKDNLAQTAPPPPPLEPAPAASTPPPAAAPAAAVDAAAPGAKSYVVKKGDTLSKIAREQLGGIQRLGDLKKANPGIDYDHLKIGQKINLP